MATDDATREQLIKLLDWNDAHAGFDAAVADLPPALRGSQPKGLPYSPWQLVEHLRDRGERGEATSLDEQRQELRNGLVHPGRLGQALQRGGSDRTRNRRVEQ